MNFPIETEKNNLKVQVSLKIYNKEVITNALYELTELCYIHQVFVDEYTLDIFFNLKENTDINTIAKEFCNKLIDQQIRYNTNNEFGHIRDLIVEQAFKPIS